MFRFLGGGESSTSILLSKLELARAEHSKRFADVDDRLFKILWDLAQSSFDDILKELDSKFPLPKLNDHKHDYIWWEGTWKKIFTQVLGLFSSGLNLQMNEFLRHIEFFGNKKIYASVQLMSFVTTRTIVTPRPLTVYRGMNLHAKPKKNKYAKYLEAEYSLYYKEFQDGFIGSNGFWSTTTDPKVAARFVTKSVKDNNIGMLCIINLPSGFPIYPLLQSSYGTGEKEIVLPLCVKFEIEDVIKDPHSDDDIVLVFLKPITRGDPINYSLLNDDHEENNMKQLYDAVPSIVFSDDESNLDETHIDKVYEFCRNAKRSPEEDDGY